MNRAASAPLETRKLPAGFRGSYRLKYCFGKKSEEHFGDSRYWHSGLSGLPWHGHQELSADLQDLP
jgi:hypothetical protein